MSILLNSLKRLTNC